MELVILKLLKVDNMGQFRFETEVQVTQTLEYIIEADSLEEALEQLEEGEYRGEGVLLDEEIDWGTSVIISEEELS
jgi:hypothetical protein